MKQKVGIMIQVTLLYQAHHGFVVEEVIMLEQEQEYSIQTHIQVLTMYYIDFALLWHKLVHSSK